MISMIPRLLYVRGKAAVLLEAGLAPEPVGLDVFGEEKKLLLLPIFEP
jgi:hypothetical protein